MSLQPQDAKWFISEKGKVAGPVTMQRLQILLRWGKFSSRAVVCDECASAWIPVGQSPFARYVVLDPADSESEKEPTPEQTPERGALLLFGVLTCAFALVVAVIA